MSTGKKSDKEIIITIPERLVEAGKLVLEKVAGKYTVSNFIAHPVPEPQCQIPGIGPMVKELVEDIRVTNQKMLELVKHLDARYGELKKITDSYKKPK